MNNAKRPNLNEVVSVAGGMPMGNTGSSANLPGISQSVVVEAQKRQPSQLALAGSMNMLGLAGKNTIATEADEERVKKVMMNMEKDKSLQFRQNTNNRGYGFQQVMKQE